MQRDRLPIIVGGCHRSGTSLVRRVLNAHSRIFCGPEVKFFRDLDGDYRDDPHAHARLFRSAAPIASRDELLEVFGPAYVALLTRAAGRAGKPRWADKNPENVCHLRDWEALLGDAWLLVQVVRHPLDTLASMAEVRFPLVLPADLAGRVAFYRCYTEAGLAFAHRHPGRHFLLRYDELARSPQPTLERLMAWAAERFEPGQLAFNAAPQLDGLEDPKVRHTTAVHADSVGRWRAWLTPEEARAAWRDTRDLWAQIDPEADEPLA